MTIFFKRGERGQESIHLTILRPEYLRKKGRLKGKKLRSHVRTRKKVCVSRVRVPHNIILTIHTLTPTPHIS